MSGQGIDPREYGRLEAQVKHLDVQVNELRDDIKTILSIMEQGKGGWRTLVFLSGIAATVGAIITWVVTHMTIRIG